MNVVCGSEGACDERSVFCERERCGVAYSAQNTRTQTTPFWETNFKLSYDPKNIFGENNFPKIPGDFLPPKVQEMLIKPVVYEEFGIWECKGPGSLIKPVVYEEF